MTNYGLFPILHTFDTACMNNAGFGRPVCVHSDELRRAWPSYLLLMFVFVHSCVRRCAAGMLYDELCFWGLAPLDAPESGQQLHSKERQSHMRSLATPRKS
eukprot:33828-Eustigmatos_ZCMA.PRE.1